MSSHRPYRSALGIKHALEIIDAEKGIKFDKEIVEVCIPLFKEKRFEFHDDSFHAVMT